MTSTLTVQHTPLYDWHVKSGGRMVDFHGWMLPVQYTSVIDEHQTVRQAAGLFDISHMGQLLIEGPTAFDSIQRLITNDLQRTFDKGLGVYGHLCRVDGGVIDDIFVYGLKDARRFLVVVNSATHQKDLAWFREHVGSGVIVNNLERRAAFAIQGPMALEIIRRTLAGIAELPRFGFQQITAGAPNETLWACRTGYTGEDGAEFFGPAETIKALWKQLLENGVELGLKPCGLGARDTLRLEMGYPLYGQELTEERTTLEANMEWALKWTKGDFIGREALAKQKAEGIKVKLLAFRLKGRGVPRQGALLFSDGKPGGETTSGTFSPSLQQGIGLAYAPAAWAVPGKALEIELHGKRIAADVVSLPFYLKPR